MYPLLLFTLGMAIPPWLPAPLPWHAPAAVAVLALSGRWPGWRTGLLVALCAGLALSALRIRLRLDDMLPPAWENRSQSVELQVIGLAHYGLISTRFDAQRLQLHTPDAALPATFSVADRERRAWPAGSVWRAELRCKRLHAYANPHAADTERWLIAQRRLANCSVRQRRALPARSSLQAGIGQMRERLRDRFDRVLGDHPAAGVLMALTLGERTGIDRAQWDVFARTGTTHLVCVSGVHLGFVAALAAWAALRLARRFGRGRWPPRLLACAAGLTAAGAYALLAGFGVSAQRALLMLAACGLALALRSRWPARKIWLSALALVTLADPWAVTLPGFWLSFGLVAALLLAGSGRLCRPGWLAGNLQAQGAVSVLSVPLLAGWFGQLPWVSPLANAWALPLIGLLLTPLSLLAVAQPFDPPLRWAADLIGLAMSPLDWLAQWPPWTLPTPPVWTLWLAGIAALLMLLPLWPLRLLLLPCWLPLLLARAERPPPGEVWATVLDVGQGLAMVVETRRHVLVYDVGPGNADWNVADSTLLPYLAGRGITAPDRVMLSHADADHAGGWPALAPRWPHSQCQVSQPEALDARWPCGACRAGQRWHWDGVDFEVFWPGNDAAALETNASSCVLKVTGAAGRSILLTGDIGRASEAALLGLPLRADVLISPHHGSRTSSGDDFLAAVAAQHVVVSAGYLNRYRHPQAAVWQRYADHGMTRWRTDRHGAIDIRLGREVGVSAWRQRAPRYWQPRDKD